MIGRDNEGKAHRCGRDSAGVLQLDLTPPSRLRNSPDKSVGRVGTYTETAVAPSSANPPKRFLVAGDNGIPRDSPSQRRLSPAMSPFAFVRDLGESQSSAERPTLTNEDEAAAYDFWPALNEGRDGGGLGDDLEGHASDSVSVVGTGPSDEKQREVSSMRIVSQNPCSLDFVAVLLVPLVRHCFRMMTCPATNRHRVVAFDIISAYRTR